MMNVQRQNPEGRLALGHTNPPHALLIEPLVRQALAEADTGLPTAIPLM